MIDLGIMSGLPLEGFEWVQLDPSHDAGGRKVAAIGGYVNLANGAVDPLRRLIGRARTLGSDIVCTASGSKNPSSEWAWDPANASHGTWDHCVQVLRDLCAEARGHGVRIALEPYVQNVITGPDQMRRLILDVDADNLGWVMDPCNFLANAQDISRQAEILPEVFAAAGDRILIAHAKDVKARDDGGFPDLPAAGEGDLDYALYIRLLKASPYRGPLIIEHLTAAQVAGVRAYVARYVGTE